MQPPSPRKHATVSSDTSSPTSTSPMPQTHSYRSASDVSEVPMYQPQPLERAVNMAFDNSGASQQISPDIVAHITEQVMNNLRLNGIVRDESQNAASHHQLDGSGPKMDHSANMGDRRNIARDDTWSTASRSPPPGDPTTLEKIWQPLFTEDGRPTFRLGQFLRGIALHIIEDFEPRNSLVITPQKMLCFYDQVRLAEEIYPWSDIFGGKMTNSSISHLYRDLNCQHHFVQRQFDEKPNIPALTPTGFQCWMTHVIQAHPEEEFVRLAKVAMDMPVSNADDRKERFPKQLSRRLLPRQPSRSTRDLLQDCVLADPAIELPRYNKGPGSFSSQGAQPPPQPGTERLSASSAPPSEGLMAAPPQPSYQGVAVERERKPFSANTSEAAVEDVPPSMPATGGPIERDRKPYSVQPGGRKVYDSDDGTSKASNKPRRSNTTSSKVPPPNDADLIDRSRAGRPRAGSQSGPHPGYMPPHRMRSPSLGSCSNPYTRSEGGEMPPSSFAGRTSNLYDDNDNELDRTFSRDSRDERVRRRRTVDMHASYPTQPKQIFDPAQYQRQQGDVSNGYGSLPNSSAYPLPSRYG